ncbi:adenine nucleotide alpha hydrolases-like protein [Backusella circina FSU 941]|nr:adenine nucleotide alpha hydrolases-like protein [Backusella circina FSU 941]
MIAAISYTGGKDCTLALHRIKQQGATVAVLVTFSPPETQSFRAHSLDIIKTQAKALGIPHTTRIIHGPNYLESYKEAICGLKKEYGIDSLVTGDILPVCSDFMERAVQGTEVALVRPLWQQDQQELLKEMWNSQFDILVTCVNQGKIPRAILEKVKSEYAVGLPLTQAGLNAIKSENVEISPTGEFGELHTMVLNCPLYVNGKIAIQAESMDDEDYVFLNIKNVELIAH